MECITEDPIPFPPDRIDDTPIHSENETSNNREHDAKNNKTTISPIIQSPLTNHSPSIHSETDSKSHDEAIPSIPPQQQASNALSSTHSTVSIPLTPSSITPDDIIESTLIMSHLGDDRQYRVKLYQLTDDGNWNDEGTGIIQYKLCNNNAIKSIEIRIISEENKILLQHTASNDILYDKQGESIIQWLDTKDSLHQAQIERAISFQHKTRCLELWKLIAYIKGHQKLSDFEAETRKHKHNEDEDRAHNTQNIQFESDEEEEDDVVMEHNNKDIESNTNSGSNGLLMTFLNDHNGKDEEEEGSDNDIDIHIDDNITCKRDKKKKKKSKKHNKSRYFDHNKDKDDRDSESDDENNNVSNTIDSSDDEDDGGTEFLQKLTMRTQKKAKKNKLEIPMPTPHNLSQVHTKIKNAVENKNVAALNQLGNIEWREALYSVFLSIEEGEIKRIQGSNTNNATKNNEDDTEQSPIPKLERITTPRLSAVSLEEDKGCHALELIFLIVLECCRECQQIKHKKNKDNNNNKSDLRRKIEGITQTQFGYIMHSSFAQLLSSGSFGHNADRSNSCTLMMVFLGKAFISKSIAMLEYDPIRRAKHERIKVSYKHRSFLKNARPKRLQDITMMNGDELYDEIEYVYQLNYVRDCVLLGKLDLEQQGFHLLNHHISRYNAVICESIADDSAFLKILFDKIKESCCCFDDNDGLCALDRSISRTVSIDDSLSPSPNVSNGLKYSKDKPIIVNGDDTGVNNNNGYDDEEYDRAIYRRRHNRKELFNARNGVLFRFLSEFLCRIKCINESQTRSAIFVELIDNGLLQTLSVCVSCHHIYPSAPFAHIWLVLVECIHHMISTAPCGNAPQVRAFIVKQITEFNKLQKDKENGNMPKTLIQRLCSAFSCEYVCDDCGILDQIYYVIIGLLGLGDLMGLESAPALSYVGLCGDRDLRSKHLKIMSDHFFDSCIPLFYRVLNGSKRYIAYKNKMNEYRQIKSIQKHIINLLSICCEQEQFIPKLREIEEKYDLMSSIHNLIYVPPDNNDKKGRKGVTNKDLSMCCIRFLRECLHLGQHDTFWSNRIKNYGLFKNILRIFDYNGLETYNMMNSSILSIFAIIEDKKIEDIILYLGNEKILQKYAKLIKYTTKFSDLIELYEKAKHGIPIQSQLDDQSTATLSNCSSLSPRISPGLKEEIHYFDEEDTDYELEQKEEEDINTIKYKDSPRPNAMRKELILPKRKKNDESFDLLSNAKAVRKKQKQKTLNLSISSHQDKEQSPFLRMVSNAMDNQPNKGIKRKYQDICSNNAKSPPKKKVKLNDIYYVNQSPDTFDTNDDTDCNEDKKHCYKNGNCTKSILLNSKKHHKHNKHVHFMTSSNVIQTAAT